MDKKPQWEIPGYLNTQPSGPYFPALPPTRVERVLEKPFAARNGTPRHALARAFPAFLSLVAITFANALFIAPAVTASASVNIPVLTWTPRSDWLNVKNAPFNATGDGVADDTNAIQAALTVATTNNSHGQAISYQRTVYLPPGTYKITKSLTWKGTNTPFTDGGSGLQLIGCGRNTTIVWSGSSGGAMFVTDSATLTNYIGITWNGNNLAGAGYLHAATIHFEDPVRHQNEAFINFTAPGTYVSGKTYPSCGIMNGISTSTIFSADVLVWNCLFSNCTNGLDVGCEEANDYQWCIEGCEFENCGTAVNCVQYGMTTIFDCHFQGSTVADISTNPSLAQSVRCCTSEGSKQFYVIPQSVAFGPQKIEDCRIDRWTSTVSAIDLGNCGPTLVADCVFTNPPGSAPPIRIHNNNLGTAELLVSNNYYPPPCTALVAPGSYGSVAAIGSGSCGGTVAALSSGSTVFLQSTWPADSTNILDVTLPPYSADKTGVADATTAIQRAINDAKAAANGSIVYLPLGYYDVSSTLLMTGSNYTVQGSGLCSVVKYTGTNGGTVFSVASPNNLAMEQLTIGADPSVVAINQTATTGGTMVYDGIQSDLANGIGSNYVGAGVQLNGLPTGSLVFIGHMLSPLTVSNCGPAEIFGRYIENGRLIVNGATQPKTGFLGISDSMEGGNVAGATYWDLYVDDNQDLVIGHLYQEQGYNHLSVNRGAGTGSGRVTIQGVKQNLHPGYTSVQVNNYQGRVYYGPTYFANTTSTIISQTGSNALDLIFPCDFFGSYAPTITTASGCRLIETKNIYGTGTTYATITYPADIMPAGAAPSIAAGLDHLRQLYAEDMKLVHSIQNVVGNGSFETDPLNSSPLATMGTPPAAWTVTGGTATALGVRSVSAAAPGSPFASGSAQSVAFVDTTGTSAGTALLLTQNTAALSATVGAVLTFDFILDSMASLNDAINVSVDAGSSTALNLSLTASGTSGSLGGSSLALNKWYRVQAILPPPSIPTGTVSYTITPWTASGPGSPIACTAAGFSTAASEGFTKVSIAETAPGSNTNVNFDNIALVAGDPLVSGSFTPDTPPGLAGLWTFDSGNAADSSGNQNNGTLVAGPLFSQDFPYLPWGNVNSIQFTGSNRIEVPNAAAINLNDQFTIAFWVNGGTNGQLSGARLLCKDGSTSSSPGWQVQRSGTAPGVMMRIDTSAGAGQIGASLNNLFDNTWHHVAFVFASGTSTAYIDGTYATSQTYNTGTGLANSSVPLDIGSGLAGAYPLAGKIDDVRLYNVSLGASEIAALYALQPEQNWKNQNFTSQQLANPNISGDMANPTGDGMVNLVKYALNLSPNTPDPVEVVPGMAVVSGSSYLCLTHRENSAAPDIDFSYEQSTDLVNWYPAVPLISNSTYLDASTNLITVEFPATGQESMFLRLQVAKP